ncbi:MAG: lipid-binding SYLF domain-containing protein, partial [Candidatus Omnitrophica bacterium]|nr:lipid-binding SYLF domain-containing protein [Candidatus Omnitrophota bacterium]
MGVKRKIIFILAAVAAAVGIFSAGVYAADEPLDHRIAEANKVLNEMMVSPDQSIPEELLGKCKAIAIYPTMIKGGFVFGARFGQGVVLKKGLDGQWGPPAFSTVVGGNWGLQIGIQATDLILVVMNERGLNNLLRTKMTLGADASFAAGPIGRESQMATDISLRTGILAYSRSRGLFAGAVFDGAVVTTDNYSNSKYYGKPVT